MRILITGGAGFIGSRLALYFKEDNPQSDVHVVDNLKRRGSETNLAVFRSRGVRFVHGDIRNREDFEPLASHYDLFVDCSAEPSVLSGTTGTPNYILNTNLVGTLNCLEFARERCAGFIFLSTSRVYSIQPLLELPLEALEDRFALRKNAEGVGFSEAGISESFPCDSSRSYYGASKLASELVIQEYAHSNGLCAVINRCGVLSGPGQFGKVDQGVVSHWLVSHVLNRPLTYFGFGGEGKQVRDVLHPWDLFRLLKAQIGRLGSVKGQVFNVGGGLSRSVSLKELTRLVRELTGKNVPVTGRAESNAVDVPYYVSDCRKATAEFQWTPTIGLGQILKESYDWLREDKSRLAA